MVKEKQKMTLNVRRRSQSSETPPAIDPLRIESFAAGAENAERLSTTQTKKVPQIKVVRDAFTMPAEDHRLFDEIIRKCLKAEIVVTKSEIVRAGLKYLAGLETSELEKIIKKVPKVKTGRPAVKEK